MDLVRHPSDHSFVLVCFTNARQRFSRFFQFFYLSVYRAALPSYRFIYRRILLQLAFSLLLNLWMRSFSIYTSSFSCLFYFVAVLFFLDNRYPLSSLCASQFLLNDSFMGISCRHLHVFSTSLPSSSLGFCPRAPLRYRQPAGPLLAIGQGAPMIRGCPAFRGLKFVVCGNRTGYDCSRRLFLIEKRGRRLINSRHNYRTLEPNPRS